MRFTLRAETALHVGDGERLTWLDHRLDGKTVHVLDWGSILARAAETHDDVAERFAAFTDRCHDLLREGESALKNAPANQKTQVLRNLRDQTSPERFAKEDLKDAALEEEIRRGKHDRYTAEFTGGRLDRRLEILTQSKDASGNPVVPASTLRGQLRSAVLHGVLAAADDATARRILDGVGELRGWEKDLATSTSGRARHLFASDVEAAVFRAPNGGTKRTLHDDPRIDLMRFLIVSEPRRVRSALVVVRVSPFAVQKVSGEKRPVPLVPTVCEAIAAGSEFEYDLSIDTALLKGLATAQGGAHALLREPFWDLFARAFGVTRDEAAALGADELEERVLSAIEVGLAGRAAALTRRDRAWFDRHDVSKDAPQRRFVERLGEHVGERLPVRIGAGAGLHGLTAIAAIELHPILSSPLRRVLGRAGLGMRPRDRRERAERERAERERSRGGPRRSPDAGPAPAGDEVDPKVLPQTRRLTMDGGGPGELLGYASFGRGELSAAPPALLPSAGRAAPERSEEPPRPRPPKDQDRGRRRGAPAKPKPGPSSPDRRKPSRPPVPDRPATKSEIDDLLKRFGPRHGR